jgi:hypothetical protein
MHMAESRNAALKMTVFCSILLQYMTAAVEASMMAS